MRRTGASVRAAPTSRRALAVSTTENQAPADRVESDPDAKRLAILQQAVEVFADEGFRHADVQVIADRAGVGKGTVYRYFGNKEDLFWATTFSVFDRLRQHILQAMEGTEGVLAELRAACLAYAEFFEANPKCLEVFVQDRAMFRGTCPESHREHHERLLGHFVSLLEQGIAAGEIRPIDPRDAMVALAATVYGAVVHSCYLSGDKSLVRRARQATDIFFEGIRAK